MMYKFEAVFQGVSNIDNKTLVNLNRILGQSLVKIKQDISEGLPVFSKELGYSETFCEGGIVEKLIFFFKENKIDVIINTEDRSFDLDEYIDYVNEVRTSAEDDYEDDFDEFIDEIKTG